MDKKKILLVDDEKDILETIKYRLEANNYQVVTAYDGQEALDSVRSEAPDLIILDLMLPKIDGYRVCGLLKKDAKYAKIPVVLFSSRAQKEDMEMGKEMGADAYITKPFETKVLLDKIEELLKTGS